MTLTNNANGNAGITILAGIGGNTWFDRDTSAIYSLVAATFTRERSKGFEVFPLTAKPPEPRLSATPLRMATR